MKILFICWANVGRSQMAATFYNHMTNTTDAESAGTEASDAGITLQERRDRRGGGTYVIDVMHEEGIDISQNMCRQLTESMLPKYDRIISMAQLEYTPQWLSQYSKYEYWPVIDPGGKGFEDTKRAMVEIKERVKQLINENPS